MVPHKRAELEAGKGLRLRGGQRVPLLPPAPVLAV